MPILRPFRALRFAAAVTDLSAVLSPPYDIIDPAQRRALLEQDPHNAVRIELPADLGDGGDEAYRDAARTVAAWRSESILVKDRVPTSTVHRMTWHEADGSERTCTGVLARLRLEAFGPGAGVLPHERTMSGPKEDRYRLLKATGLNTSPIVLLAGSDPATTVAALQPLVDRPPDVEATTPDGVSHRLWVYPTPDPGLPGDPDRPSPSASGEGEGGPPAVWAGALLELLGSAPLTIADGHHRYETALRYRDERGSNRACESDPAWDYVLALVYPVDLAPLALPTHRVVRGEPRGQALIDRLADLGSVEAVDDSAMLLERMSAPPDTAADPAGSGRIGLFTAGRAAILRVDRTSLDGELEDGLSETSRALDVNALSAAIAHAYGADAPALAGEGRLTYVKDAVQAVRQVADEEASACFLLDPMPAWAISRVAEAGEVMPQKSTYFHPKAPTGLLFSPLEW